jgi:hypothetical protein
MADRTGQFYAAEESVHGYGAELQVGEAGSPNSFESIAGIRSITPGEMSTEDIDRTHLRSPYAHREHRPGLRNSGAFTVEGILLPGEQSQNNAGGGTGPFATGGLIALWRERGIHDFQIVLGEGSPSHLWPFRGYVSQFQLGEIGPENLVTFTASFMPTEAFDADLP